MLTSWKLILACVFRLTKRDKILLSISTALQIALSLFDIIGVALIGILGSIAIRSQQSGQFGDRTRIFLQFFNLTNMTVQHQAVILGGAAAFFLVSKTLLSMELSRRTFGYFGRRNADLTSNLLKRILNQPLSIIQMQSSQDILYFSTMGVSALTIGVLGSIISILADSALLVVMLAGLFLVEPSVALLATLIFGLVFLTLHFGLSSKMSRLGQSNFELNLAGNKLILETIHGYRELAVNSRIQTQVDNIRSSRSILGEIDASLNFLPNLSKYIFEVTIVVAAFVISASQFIYYDADHALSTLTVFMAASTRIAPAILRIQQSAMRIKGSFPVVGQVLNYFQLEEPDRILEQTTMMNLLSTDFTPAISVKSLNTRYPQQTHNALENLNLEILPGEFVALVGPSGGGKSTLVDTLLGIQPTSAGQVLISNQPPLQAIARWPGAIGYVPQEVFLTEGTIRENIQFGFSAGEIPDTEIERALDMVGLTPFLRSLDLGLNTQLGENGARISGGQKQRIGIARALVTRPKLLIMDEATSALDAESERNIEETINNLSGSLTVLVVAHRLSTVVNAHKVVYIENGTILAEGDFEYVRSEVPNFDSQAKLMGL